MPLVLQIDCQPCAFGRRQRMQNQNVTLHGSLHPRVGVSRVLTQTSEEIFDTFSNSCGMQQKIELRRGSDVMASAGAHPLPQQSRVRFVALSGPEQLDARDERKWKVGEIARIRVQGYVRHCQTRMLRDVPRGVSSACMMAHIW